MSVKKETVKDLEVYTITTSDGSYARVTNIGACILNLVVPNKKGEMVDVLLGYENLDDYKVPGSNHGAVCGRFANRIEDARFTIGDKEYILEPNYNEIHMLHGGHNPISRRMFTLVAETENSITLRTLLPDGENGFPGNMTVDVIYTFDENKCLSLHYIASCDADSVVSLTNHAYFNLNGHRSGNVHEHIMQINADTYAPLKENFMVYGTLLPVDSVFDFRTPKKIGRDIETPGNRQLEIAGGYDHAWTVRNDGKNLVNCANVYSEESGIHMAVDTNSPTVLVYTGNKLPGFEFEVKGGGRYVKRGGVCLETGFYPNALRFPEFGQGYIKKGEVFDYTTTYTFSVK